MKKITYLLFLFAVYLSAQTEPIGSVSVGAGPDYVNQPISAQSDFSHSQTIYFPEELGFVGNINEIRYQTVFSSTYLTNSNEWIVKIGLTDVDEFSPGSMFIQNETLVEVFNGTVSSSGYDVIVAFNPPFYYDGTQNLIIDVQETTPGHAESSTIGFKGKEDFGNPPARSRMTFTLDGSTDILRENSVPRTKFLGNLERCATVWTPNITDISYNSATVTLQENENIAAYNYNVSVQGEQIPDNYTTTSEMEIILDDLEPATAYSFNIKADCDLFEGNFQSYSFSTEENMSTADYEKNNFSVFPNPGSTEIYISSESIIERLEIYNIVGKMVHKRQPPPKEAQTTIDISSFNSGIYFIKIWDDQQNHSVKKMIKK